MKKFLSLVLALTMMMSLVTINAGAKEFTDDEDQNYDEAIAVISEIGAPPPQRSCTQTPLPIRMCL